MKAFNVTTSNLVAAREGTTAREIGTNLIIGNFNGLPVIDSSIKIIGIVTAVDILGAIRQGRDHHWSSSPPPIPLWPFITNNLIIYKKYFFIVPFHSIELLQVLMVHNPFIFIVFFL